MALPLGTYTIVNAFHKNFACLLNSNDGEPMVGTITSDSTYYKWNLKPETNGRYLIQSTEFDSYVWVGHRPQSEEEIVAMSRKCWWEIQKEPKGNYWICPVGNTDLSWSLSDVDNETPIRLQSANSNPRCHWKILSFQSNKALAGGENRSVKRVTFANVDNTRDQELYAEGISAYDQGRYVDAEAALKEVVNNRRRMLGDHHEDTVDALYYLGRSICDQGRDADAAVILEEVLASQRHSLGDQNKNTLWTLYLLGRSVYNQGRYADAEAMLREVVAGRRRVLRENHKDTLRALYWLGVSIYNQRRYADAEVILKEAVAGRWLTLGELHNDTLIALYFLGRSVYEQGRFVDAEEVMKKVVAGRRSTLGAQHSETLSALYWMGISVYKQSRYTDSETMLKAVVDGRTSVLGHHHKLTQEAERELLKVQKDRRVRLERNSP